MSIKHRHFMAMLELQEEEEEEEDLLPVLVRVKMVVE
jgi:hypothetical protein